MHHFTSHLHLRRKKSKSLIDSPQIPPSLTEVKPTDSTLAEIKPTNPEANEPKPKPTESKATEEKPAEEPKSSEPAEPAKFHPVAAYQARMKLVASSKPLGGETKANESAENSKRMETKIPQAVLLHQARMNIVTSRIAVGGGQQSEQTHAPLPKHLVDHQAHMDIIAARIAATAELANKAKQTPAPVPKGVLAHGAKMKITASRKAVAFSPTPPQAVDILRYRYHHGTNLGSIYVLERWLFPSAFPDSTPDSQTSELSSVRLWVQKIGAEETRKKFEARWANVMSETDWDWLANTGRCTSIRLPIGYFTLGPDFCKGTPFEPYSAVYVNSWSSAKALINKARVCGIGILVDLHALPGGANPGDHSGTNSNVTGLWKNPTNLDLATKCLTFLAREIDGLDGVIGLQLCNEAIYGADGMYDWYDSVLSQISAINSTIPLYISDAWDLGKAINWIKNKNTAPPGNVNPPNPMVIDTHLYYCFDDKDKSCSPSQIIDMVPSTLSELNGKTQKVLDSGAAAVIVGEYSCTLDPKTWSLFPNNGDKDETRKEFGNKQCEHYYSTASGAYFWTLKMDWMPGDDWGFVAQTSSGAVCPPKYLSLTQDEVRNVLTDADSNWENLRDSAYNSHVAYWDKQCPDEKFDHGEYKRGWELGWNDARAFFASRSEGWFPAVGADRIGLKDIWVRKRICEVGGNGGSVWEFEQGLWKGIGDFEGIAFN